MKNRRRYRKQHTHDSFNQLISELPCEPTEPFEPVKLKRHGSPTLPVVTHKNTTTLDLIPSGSYNGSLIPFGDDFICVYRGNESHFLATVLDKEFKNKTVPMLLPHTAAVDPRLVWHPDGKQLLLIYSCFLGGFPREHMRVSKIMDLNASDAFVRYSDYRVSPEELDGRQKNWTPFIWDGHIYLVSDIAKQACWEIHYDDQTCWVEKVSESPWKHKWPYKGDLRGSTNAVQLPDGTYLGTFHTGVCHKSHSFYDTGCYLFEGKPPFKVIAASRTPFLRADDATHPFCRKHQVMLCCFPMSMILRGQKVLISYGDNDSSVKVLETDLKTLMGTMQAVSSGSATGQKAGRRSSKSMPTASGSKNGQRHGLG